VSEAPSNLGAEQLQLISRAQHFLDRRLQGGHDVAVDPQSYLNSWADILGNATLRCLALGWRAQPARLLATTRDTVAGLRLRRFGLAGQRSTDHEFENLIVSWALPQDFNTAGHYTDRYFGLASSDTPRTLWFLILLNGTVPAQLPRNVRILHRLAVGLRPLRWPLGTSLLADHCALRTGGARFMRPLSGTIAEARAIAAAVRAQLSGGRFRQVITPYEAQPFQHAVYLAVKAENPGIRTVGYIHSTLPALPTDFIFRRGAPDRLLVHGTGQAEILVRHLGWPESRLRAIPSLRYLRSDAAPFAGRILLPYSVNDAASVVRSFESIMRSARVMSMPRWEVRNHPVMISSRKHLALARRLRAITEQYADRTGPHAGITKQTIIIGATAAVIEALERGLDVVHICVNPLFETHSPAIWAYMDAQNLGRNVYRYRLREAGRYIQLGETRAAGSENLEIG
jgi:hypothetical protein